MLSQKLLPLVTLRGQLLLLKMLVPEAILLTELPNSNYTIGAATTTGTLTIGGTAQTGIITLGSSSGINTLNIANGAGTTTLNLANVQTAGAINMGAGMTTGDNHYWRYRITDRDYWNWYGYRSSNPQLWIRGRD